VYPLGFAIQELEISLRLASLLAASAFCILLPLGCGSPGAHLPKTVPAAGVVTLDGQPVDGAQVVFVPANEGTTTGAYGTTNASGHFSVRAFDEKEGAIPGEYKIQVSKTKEVKLPGKLDGGDAVRFDYAVPPKYTGAKTSGLSVTVPETGKKDINLTLTSK
jgi:hypothetical protein